VEVDLTAPNSSFAAGLGSEGRRGGFEDRSEIHALRPTAAMKHQL
jgi:hypothetical protein